MGLTADFGRAQPTVARRRLCHRFLGAGFDIAERMGLVPGLRREGYDIQELRVVDAEGRRVGGFDAGVFRRLTGER
jgi:hypothetical protein